MGSRPIPTPSVVMLIGPPASGKSTWAAEHFRPEQVVCADTLRATVGEHQLDLGATDDAFELLDRIVELRLGRGLTTVIDTTGLDPARRRAALALARRHDLTTVAVRFTTSAAECRRRNRERPQPVPAAALDAMIKKAREVSEGGLRDEGWDLVIESEPVRTVTRRLAPTAEPARTSDASDRTDLQMGLLVSDLSALDDPSEIAPTLARVAAAAEDVGFRSFWLMDHLVQIPQVGRRWDPILDPWTALGHVAAVTTRIRLGVLVSPVTFRHPALLAKSIATLDVLSNGRVIAGIGAGSSEHEHAALGIPFAEPGDRLRLLRDVAQALPILLGPGGRRFDGEVLSIPDTSLYPRPIQPRVPLIVGGSGERVTLRIAAEFADGCNLFGDVGTVGRLVGSLRDHCAAVDRDPAEVEVTHLGTMLLGGSPGDLRDRVARLRPPNVGPDRFAEHVHAGTVDDHAAGLRRFLDAGVQHAIVSVPDAIEPGALEPFGDLIARFR